MVVIIHGVIVKLLKVVLVTQLPEALCCIF